MASVLMDPSTSCEHETTQTGGHTIQVSTGHEQMVKHIFFMIASPNFCVTRIKLAEA